MAQIGHERAKLHTSMIVYMFGYGGNHVIMRTALNMGVSKLVLPLYRNILALLLVLPFAHFMEKKVRPSLTISFLIQLFLLGLVGITLNQGFYIFGLAHTSPTFASAIENAVPAVTFLMAALLRIEQVHLKRKDGIAKVLGTLTSVIGASVITLYKGPTIYRLNQPLEPLNSLYLLGDENEKNWTLGCVFLIAHCLCWSTWIVLQPSVLKRYPAPLSITSYSCFFSVLQFLAFAGFLERDSQAWMIHSSGELFSILYLGLVGSGMVFTIQLWVVERGGPLFFSVYLPLQTLIVAVSASIILGENFYLGGIIGAVLIIAGMYLVVWGKSEENKFSSCDKSYAKHLDSTVVQPLLKSSESIFP